MGAFSVPRDSVEGATFLDAGEHSDPGAPQNRERVHCGGELLVNPLMSLYFTFELDAVARHCQDLVASPERFREVGAVIEGYRHRLEDHRPLRALPH